MRTVLIDEYQEVTGEMLTDIGEFARSHVDAVVRDGIAAGNFYTGCEVAQNGAAGITVAGGRVYLGGKVYYRDESTGYALTANLPITTLKLATVVAYGSEAKTDLTPLDFLVNEATGEAEGKTVPVELRRSLDLSVLYGAESPNPARAEIGTGLVPVADILLSKTGVMLITMVEGSKLQSAEKLRERIDGLDAFREGAGKRIDTLASDISNLAEGQKGIPSANTLRSFTMDIARLKRLAKIPTLNVGYSFDYYMDASGSDLAHPSWLATCMEGIRFPPAAIRIAPLRTLNPNESKVKRTGDFVLPAYGDDVRISVVGNDSQISLADNQYQTTTMVQRTISRSATSYGTTYTTCTNRAEFQSGTFNATTQTLTKANGETFNVEFTGRDFGAEAGVGPGHLEVRLQQYWTDTWNETYWDAVTTTEGINGSICGQTFLNNAAGWLTGLNLFFSKVGNSGSVKLLLTETNSSAAPDMDKVIATQEVAAADLKVYPLPTPFKFAPRYMEPGKRYGIVVVTNGQHFACQVTNNKYAQGTFFQSTDQAWFQGDILKDLAFEAVFAKFTSARVEVDLDPLVCDNGISNLKMLIAGKVPDGTKLVWEIKPSTGNDWFPVAPGTGMAPFNGLPPTCQFRAVFIGTVDLMPGVDLYQSETWAWRPRTDFTWLSKNFTLAAGVTTTSVVMEYRLENFDPAHHTFAPTLLIGSTSYNPSSTVTEADPYDPKAFIKRVTWSGLPATNAFRFKAVGTTDVAANTFIISTNFWNAR